MTKKLENEIKKSLEICKDLLIRYAKNGHWVLAMEISEIAFTITSYGNRDLSDSNFFLSGKSDYEEENRKFIRKTLDKLGIKYIK